MVKGLLLVRICKIQRAVDFDVIIGICNATNWVKQRTNIHTDKLNTFNLLGDHRDKLNERFCLVRETQNVEHDTMRK